MGGLSKILKPVGIGLGAAALGSYLFPQTMSSITGGLLGSSATPSAASSVLGDIDIDINGDGLIGENAIGDILNKSSPSIWSNPTVLSSGILAGTSLLGGLFGSSAEDELAQASLEEQKRQFDAKMALEQAQLAQALEIAKLRGGGGGGNGAAVNAQLRIAKANLRNQVNENKAQAMQMPLQYLGNQAAAAQNTGAQQGTFFNNMAQILQSPALRRA